MRRAIAAHLRTYPWSLRFRRVIWHLDKRALRDIEAQCFEPDMRSDDTKLWRIGKDRSVYTYLVFHGRKPIAYMSGMALEHRNCAFDPDKDPLAGWQEHNTIYIDSIAVVPEYAGSETLAFLIHEYMRIGKRLGFTYSTAHARRSNGLTHYLQRKMGFIKLSTAHDWYGTGEDFDYLRLTLNREPEPGIGCKAVINLLRRIGSGTVLERRMRGKTGVKRRRLKAAGSGDRA